MAPGEGGISWEDALPPEGVPCFPAVSPRGGQHLRGYILSPSLVGCWTHWVEPRSVPCTGPGDHCLGCRCNYSRRWRGYLYVWTGQNPPIAILELTAMGARPHKDRLEGRGKPIVGCQIHVARKGGNRQGRLLVEIADLPKPGLKIPELTPLRWSLQRLWDAPTRGVVPPAVRYEDDQGDELIPFPGAS